MRAHLQFRVKSTTGHRHSHLTFITFAACRCSPPWYFTLHLRVLLWSALVGWKVRFDVTINWPPSSVCVCASFFPGWFHWRTGGEVGQEWSTEQDAVCAPVAPSSFMDKWMESGSPATVTTFTAENLRADHLDINYFLSEATWLNTCFRYNIKCNHIWSTKADPAGNQNKKKKGKR